MEFWRVHIRKKKLVSLEGWYNILTDIVFGKNLQKLAIMFFSQDYVQNYIINSKINKSYF